MGENLSNLAIYLVWLFAYLLVCFGFAAFNYISGT
jgi:hypothetical protein